MKGKLVDLGRQWGVGVCLVLWCCVAYFAMLMPVFLLFLVATSGFAKSAVMAVICAYVVICVPLLAYKFGRAFGLRFDRTSSVK